MFDPHTLTILTLGFVLGLRHALDADHLAALSTVLAERPSLQASTSVGFFWGLGHTLMLLGVGSLLLALNLTIPESVATLLEFGVGVMLVGLGLSLARRLYRERRSLHVHEHTHDGRVHAHAHGHHAHTPSDHTHDHWFQGSLRPLTIGMAHGLAGSAGLMLLILSTVSGVGQGMAYIVIFGIGSILGMVGIAALFSVPVVYALHVGPLAHRTIQGMACAASIGLGMVIMVRNGLGL